MLTLLLSMSLAQAATCDDVLLNVSLDDKGFHVRGADDVLYPGGRPAIADNPEMKCSTATCAAVGDFNWAGLDATLDRLQGACPTVEGAQVVLSAELTHDVFLEALDHVDARFPNVIVGGGAQGYGGGGTPTTSAMLLRPGQLVVYDRAFSLDSDASVLAQAFELGTKAQTTLKIEAADSATFGELAGVMRAASSAGYVRFEHSDPNGKRLHKTTTPGGGGFAPVKRAEISSQELNAGIQPVVPAVLGCYNDALAKDPGLKGTVEVSITITAQGHVSGVEVTSGIEPHLDRCVSEAVEDARFAAPGGLVVRTFPFALAPG